MAVEYIGHNNDDGMSFGLSSSQPISFYGATPTARQTLANAAVATTVAISTTTTKWGFSTSTQANALVALVNEIRAALVTAGLLA